MKVYFSPTPKQGEFSWTGWYLPFMQGLMFGMLALVVQQSISKNHLNNQLLKGPLEFDIFYTRPFLPIRERSRESLSRCPRGRAPGP